MENKRLNLLFIEGNRQGIDKSNVVEAFNKIKALGFIEYMPMEYFPIEEIKDKLGDRKLLKPTIVRMKGEGTPIISNFKIELEPVNPEEYENFDGICEDGQHRYLALMFEDLKNIIPFYNTVSLPDNMDILSYISIRNNGKKWSNEDYYNSNISTGDKQVDYILSKLKEGYVPLFLFNIYTLGTANLTANQIKSLQQGYKKLSDFSRVQIDKDTQTKGDELLKSLTNNSFLSKDRFTGRFGAGLKQFYYEIDRNFERLKATIELIDKDTWEKYFTPKAGQSMEAKSFKEAFIELSNSVISN
ncbi:MAG: hypothetical protein LUH15_20855 [Tannerellaceae bacterium]|nr:hypothetical protein [Tannerellaceae bacterium]